MDTEEVLANKGYTSISDADIALGREQGREEALSECNAEIERIKNESNATITQLREESAAKDARIRELETKIALQKQQPDYSLA